MKKKILLFAALLMFVVSTVSASSINGDYEGNPIVKLISNGTIVDPGEVPAIIYNGKTLVPIAALRNIGAEVTWSPDTYSVNVVLPEKKLDVGKETFKTLNNISSNLGGKNFKLIYDSMGSYLTVRYDSTGDNNKDADALLRLAALAGISDSDEIRISVYINQTYSAEIAAAKTNADLWLNKTLSDNQFFDTWIVRDSQGQILDKNTLPTQQLPSATSKKLLDPWLLYSNDGKTYLGKLTTNEFDQESIFNEFGTYGGQFSAKSIFNNFGIYGGEFSNQSPFNKFATKPPMIFYKGNITGYLTINSSLTNAITPIGLKETLKELGY